MSEIMKLTPEQEERQHIESILHYMDEYPCSGQNREGAVIIRKLLAAAPLVAAIDDNGETIVNHDEAKQFAYLNRKRSNISRCYLDLVGQVAPQATPSDDSNALAEVYDAALEIAAMYVENHCVDGEMHANAILTSKRPVIKENCIPVAWPQATVEPMINERVAFESWVADSGRSHLLARRNGDRGWYTDLTVTAWWTAWEARALLTTPLISKADTGEIKDHILREAVNEITHVALTYHAHQSLRERIAEIVVPLVKSATPSTIKADQASDKHPSALFIAGIARKHFGNPIPPAACAFASELIAATLATVKAEPTGEQL